MASLLDFGCFKEPFFDQSRVDFLRRHISKEFGFEMKGDIIPEESNAERCFTNFRLRRRPISPDDVLILGPMRDYPNVILNVAYGSHGFRAPPGGMMLRSLIEADGEADAIFGKEIMKAVDSKRMFI